MASTEETIARVIAGGRVAYGAACMVAPGIAAGPAGARAEGQLRWMVRAFGVRDVILGAGTLRALRDDPTSAVGWVEMSAAADGLDLANAVVFHKELDRTGVIGVFALAVPATLGGWWAAQKLRASAGS